MEHQIRPRSCVGIGQTVVRGLVEAHGGTVVCISAGDGQGSEQKGSYFIR